MEQQVDLSLFFEYPDEDDEADVAKDEHYEFYEADVDEKYQSDEAVYEVPIQQKFNQFLGWAHAPPSRTQGASNK